MMNITNREEIVEQLAEMLIQFDKELNSAYQTDVYLYIDDDGYGRLDTFVNVGGNSWINDDHYTIYSDKEHYDNMYEVHYQDIEYIAEVLDISVEQLKIETMQYCDYDDVDDVEWYNIMKYVDSRDDYRDKLIENYENFIDSETYEYMISAEEIFKDWERAMM